MMPPPLPSPATMSRTDPLTTAQAAKRITILLRESRSALRRLDKLTAMAAVEDPPLPSLMADARDGLERVVHHLTRQEHTLKAQTCDAVRRR